MLRVHHLDCCTMCPVAGRRLVNDVGRLVAHCLLVETPTSGLVLVDTGLGLDDLAAPHRLGGVFHRGFRPRLDPAQPAVRQVERLGFRADDVRHVVLTHLDVDHAGGLSDFPRARVHVHADEHAAATAPPSFNERSRYRPVQWAHGPDWAPYRADGEPWFGFAAARSLPGLPEEILAVPLPGHTRGHAAVAVRTADRWLLHAGDAYFHQASVTAPGSQVPGGLRFFERSVAVDRRLLADNHRRLRELASDHAAEVAVFSAHDPHEFARLAAREPRPQ